MRNLWVLIELAATNWFQRRQRIGSSHIIIIMYVYMRKLTRKKARSFMQRVVVILLICLSFGSIGLSGWLDQRYYEAGPRSPQPEVGRTHPLYVHHGTVVYLTYNETLAYQFVPALSLLFFAAGVCLDRRWNKLTGK
jgi:hypothetical protein